MPPEPPPARVLDQRRAIGDRIRTARLEAAITQETLAERTGLDRKTIVGPRAAPTARSSTTSSSSPAPSADCSRTS
ncbi:MULTISPECIES: helix-turn-helix domain-containing protein [unclassified Streptomyces]|uniref:helix-turn-helix domain-containing protein n=1 Tax=unclassified Streptomyces TaxID=2593676 RepID=UPI001EF115DC|nr:MULTISPECIES: helix-turn-helix transcriptional regulator [unclassified Streptomyces]